MAKAARYYYDQHGKRMEKDKTGKANTGTVRKNKN